MTLLIFFLVSMRPVPAVLKGSAATAETPNG